MGLGPWDQGLAFETCGDAAQRPPQSVLLNQYTNAMNFDIDPGLPVPIYRQIVEQVRRQVAGGAWRAGDELPSVRALALQHAINPMTVSKAYSLLEAEGLLERKRGMGMVVADEPPDIGSPPPDPPPPLM